MSAATAYERRCCLALWSSVDRSASGWNDFDDPKFANMAAVYLKGIRAVLAEANVAEMAGLLARYRNETPIGHQPHMIAHQASALLGKVTQ